MIYAIFVWRKIHYWFCIIRRFSYPGMKYNMNNNLAQKKPVALHCKWHWDLRCTSWDTSKYMETVKKFCFKHTVMQVEKPWKYDHLGTESKSWKLPIPIIFIFDFVDIHPKLSSLICNEQYTYLKYKMFMIFQPMSCMNSTLTPWRRK